MDITKNVGHDSVLIGETEEQSKQATIPYLVVMFDYTKSERRINK